MKTAIVIRHAERQDRADNASGLSPAGVAQARAAGARCPRFDLVVTSPLPRAKETAAAMGFAVSRVHPALQEIGERVEAHVRWSDGYRAWAEARRSAPAVAAYADALAALVRGWLDEVPEGGALLVVTHGGIVEALAAGLAPGFDGGALEPGAGYAEGFEALIAAAGEPALRRFPAPRG
ncbi:phosphoglycerate mutase family protein [Tepidiforma sp.]|jgi:broad specificity phosphatase PhoE|uniref:phosphoglycerate mutase family protein n=1 Tax=Tepidiforma sp. TaxID=2682230 RepID=UPI002608AB26|nr:phosphoglycerate mutase family protein [Tepidiforma sp.]MCX7618461.1 histidine phosphatase family protein [Tepidiforma sp.]